MILDNEKDRKFLCDLIENAPKIMVMENLSQTKEAGKYLGDLKRKIAVAKLAKAQEKAETSNDQNEEKNGN